MNVTNDPQRPIFHYCPKPDEWSSLASADGLIQWNGTPVHQFEELGFTVDLPRTDELFTRCLLLPMNSMLTDDEVNSVISEIRSFYGA